jgi:lauroyl/myristoyl acyltransferase
MTETTERESFDLAAALEIVQRPREHVRMPPASLPIRLKTSPWLRRLLPTRLVVARAERHGQAVWENSPEERSEAEATMAVVVGGTHHADAIAELARLYLIETVVDTALFWQPWPTPSLDPESAARVRRVLPASRGVVVSSCHVGAYRRTSSLFVSQGRAPFVVAGAWFFEKPSHDYWGRRLARVRQGSLARPIPAKGSFTVLQALLERGEMVLLYFDSPGGRETQFLGKTATLADGTARLAVEADALVLPVRTRRVRHTVWLDVAAPLDPRDFPGVKELHDALAAQHERSILEFPAAMEDPRGFGWGAGATAQGWTRPEPRSSSR